MAERGRFTIPLGNYPSGAQTFGPFSVSGRVDRLTLRLARNTAAQPAIWPNAGTVLTVRREALVAGEGVDAGSFSAPGGPALDKAGAQATEFVYSINWQSGEGRNGSQIRAEATITGGPLRTQGLIVAEG